MEASVRRVLGTGLPVNGGRWLRSTVANRRLAGRYRIGRVFLAGDAAHVFSAGGSSLNTGMLDAVDLASRLAAVLDGRKPLATLEEYHTVRHAAGEQTLLQTRAQAALSSPGPAPTPSGGAATTPELTMSTRGPTFNSRRVP